MYGRVISRIAVTLLLTACLATTALAKRIYVKWDAPGPVSDGKTWATAYTTVQRAIRNAAARDDIWVARGEYVVGSLTLRSRVGLYGGFAGTETSRDQRDPVMNETILDGDQQGSVLIIPPGAAPDTTVDGFSITNGVGRAVFTTSWGGAIYCVAASATIENNMIWGNSAYYGGAIYCSGSTDVLISGNIIIGNSAAQGGAILMEDSKGVITRNKIISNDAGSGGGIYTYASDTVISSNLIYDNYAALGGGAAFLTGGKPLLINNTIVGDYTSSDGGGIYLETDSGLAGPSVIGVDAIVEVPSLLNNIVASCTSGVYVSGYDPLVQDYSDFWNNSDYDYSGIEPGDHDIAEDPQFLDPDNLDFMLAPGSPCENSGDNTYVDPTSLDLAGNARIQPPAGIVDMGAYEDASVPSPIISPDGGTYTAPVSVTMSISASGAEIHYTLDGSDPNAGSPVYTGPINIAQTTTVKAIGIKDGWENSPIAQKQYVIQICATPTFNPDGGSYSGAQNVTISTTTAGAQIRYTTNGSTPTPSSTLYSGPVAISATTTLKAIAVKSGWGNSAVKSATYTITGGGAGLQNISLSPSSGSIPIETKRVLTAVYSDSRGYSHLTSCCLLVNSTSSTARSLYVKYDPIKNKLYFRDDGSGSWMGGYAPGTNNTIANGYARIYCADTSVNKSGNTITVAWAVLLKSPYASRPICYGYLYCANDLGGSAGWDLKGTYSVQ